MPAKKKPAKKATRKPAGKMGPVRLPAIPEDQLTAEQRALMGAIASGPRGTFKMSGPFFCYLHAPGFGELAQKLGAYCRFGTSIAPIYARTVGDFAQSAAFMHEVSGGRFRFGIGVSHAPAHVRMGVTPGKPLGDIRNFVAKLRAHEGIGALPPVILATLRKQMIALTGEIADGMVFANGARSHMASSLAAEPKLAATGWPSRSLITPPASRRRSAMVGQATSPRVAAMARTLAPRYGAFACPWAGLALPFGRGLPDPGSVRPRT